MIHNTDMAPAGQTIGMSIKPDNIHLMKKGPPETEVTAG